VLRKPEIIIPTCLIVLKGGKSKKNFSRGWNFSTFAAHLVEQDLF